MTIGVPELIVVSWATSAVLVVWAFVDLARRRGKRWPWVLLIVGVLWITGGVLAWVPSLVYLTNGRHRLERR